MNLEKNISLKQYNTFAVDVSAKFFAKVYSEVDLLELLSDEKIKTEKRLFIGDGSNILFTKDFNGIIIKICSNKIEIISENNESVYIEADAGVEWDIFVKYCVDRGLRGAENLSYIPGTVGAAPIQNIGAYGVEVKSIIESVNVIYLDTLEEKKYINKECIFGYRQSIFKRELKDKIIVTTVLFKLSKKNKLNLTYAPLAEVFKTKNRDEIELGDVREAIISIRKSKLPEPNEIGNAGSFFKNPIISKNEFDKIKKEHSEINGYATDKDRVKISAGWLIEKCGLKGKRIGNVGVHEKQALVIVNYGGASGMEILQFSKMIQKKVKEKFDIEIINEVNII